MQRKKRRGRERNFSSSWRVRQRARHQGRHRRWTPATGAHAGQKESPAQSSRSLGFVLMKSQSIQQEIESLCKCLYYSMIEKESLRTTALTEPREKEERVNQLCLLFAHGRPLPM
ncbi:hypothetical protein QJS10_CPB20g00895 [Acorus calamus]|uniref:Uncharacterized protein n=1 Tax=Acorus calamus TaxID=4465 RepID=A0AAV9C9E0_ACOCL|nr:hypothetical protein QJS10_CPB20g00895 [Acorus calamus]